MNEWLPKFKGRVLLEKIAALTGGLTYISEIDAPVEPVNAGPASLVAVGYLDKNADRSVGVRQTTSKEFFSRLTAQKEWFGPDEQRSARRFADLERLLEENLRDLTTFRVGHIQIDIYVVGLDADKDLIGIKTKAVET